MTRLISTIELSGPFFTKDVKKTFQANVRAMLEAMAEEGQTDVQSQFTGHIDTGEGVSGVKGRVHGLSGKPWEQTMVISQQHIYPWAHGGSKQYRGGRLEAKVHMFRRTATRLRKSRAVNVAELTKGLE